MTETRRLFFALWPDEVVREQIAAIAAERVPPDSRPMARANYHVTLAFLGEVDAAREACVIREAGQVDAPGFDLALDRVAHWRRPQILWLGPDQIPPALQIVEERLATRLQHCEFRPDEKSYRPHVTLARRVGGQLLPCSVSPILWQVASFSLLESRPGASGPVYTVLESWPLSE